MTNCTAGVRTNPKQFWSFARCNNKAGYYPPILSWGSESAEEPLDKAELFNSYFASVFSTDDGSQKLPTSRLVRSTSKCDHSGEALEELRGFQSHRGRRNTGGGSSKCATSLAPSLTNIINLLLNTGKFPKIWKHANVCPIFKKGSKLKVNNYRPVSLLSICSKILERCVFEHIIPVIDPMLHSLQHGFCKGKSINTQIKYAMRYL